MVVLMVVHLDRTKVEQLVDLMVASMAVNSVALMVEYLVVRLVAWLVVM